MADWNCEKCRTDIGLCQYCDDGSEFEPMSQADKIRAMTDEELAELLSFKVSGCQMCIHRYVVCVDESFDCKDGVLQWLKSEAKE